MSEDVTDIAGFVSELQRQEASPKTIQNYQSDLECFARWYEEVSGEAFSPGAITPTDIREYRDFLVAVQGCKPATINRRLAALRKFFSWAKAMRKIDEVPTEAVKGVRSDPRAPKSLDKREVDRLIRAAERDGDKRNLAILQTLRHTGMRVGELCSLRLDDLEISERKGRLIIRSGKGAKQREVPLNVDARRAITAYLEVRPQVVDEHLFIGQRNEGLKVQALENVVEKYARLAGLEDVTPHTLRHTFGTQVLRSGEDLVTVARLLGHERIETTSVYTQPSERDLERAVSKLETN